MLSRALEYTFVSDFGGGDPRLLFASVDWTVVPDALTLRIGQLKRPFSRPFLALASQLSMVDRPLPVGPAAFGDDADVGVMLHNGTAGAFEYAVGVFHGAGPGMPSAPVHPLLAARIGYQTAGSELYRESDIEGGPPRFGFAAAGLVDFDGDGDRASFASGLVDVAFKADGLALTSAIYVGSHQDGPRWWDRDAVALGHYAQVGYVIGGRVEPVIRLSSVLPAGAGNDRHELAGGLNLFFRGHALKWQTFVTSDLQPRDGRDTRDVRVQSQLGLAF